MLTISLCKQTDMKLQLFTFKKINVKFFPLKKRRHFGMRQNLQSTALYIFYLLLPPLQPFIPFSVNALKKRHDLSMSLS